MSTTTHTFKRIDINTGGCDAPGVDAIIHDGTPALDPNSLGTAGNERNEPVSLVAVS